CARDPGSAALGSSRFDVW
nr:immunoglobulin heavy chain junction region [Macaca mulatta]MOW79029.1 immunoglobulin heavy chain junction region [Macaca mulatta]